MPFLFFIGPINFYTASFSMQHHADDLSEALKQLPGMVDLFVCGIPKFSSFD